MVPIDYGPEALSGRPTHPYGTVYQQSRGIAEDRTTWPHVGRHPKQARQRARAYFWRRVLLLVLVAGTGAVASSLAERLMASASPTKASVRACPVTLTAASAGVRGSAALGTCISTTYIARPGDTIWGIAVRFSGDGDPRPLEYRLEDQIGGGTLQPGDVLRVP